jgi:hypothetical protein
MELKRGDFGRIIGKPVFGQEGMDLKEFHAPIHKDRIRAYMDRVFSIYSGCIFQPYVDGFKQLEYKIVFVGERPIYGLYVYSNREQIFLPEKEPKVIAFAKKVVAILPKPHFKGTEFPHLLLRIDIGCCFGNSDYFVSELEFVPSIWMNPFNATDALIGEQCFKMIRQLSVKT